MGNMAGVAVPRVIHWWWDGPELPEAYARFRDRWAELHPGWSLVVWDEARFLAEFGPDHPVVQLYRNRARWSPHAHEWGWKTNIARYLILQRDGGLWVDADLEPLKAVDPLIERLEASENHNALAAYEDRTHVNNAFLASTPGGSFITAVVDGLGRRIKAKRGKPSNVVTGPHYLTELAATYPELLVLDRALVYPMHWSELDRRGEDFPAAYTLHHWHRKSTEQTSRAGHSASGARSTRARPGTKPERIKITAGPHHRPEGVPRPAAPVQMRKSHMVPPTRIRKIPGLTPESVALALADMAAQVPPDRAIVELGTYQGRTALFMAWGARQGQGAHVYAIDPWDLPGERGPYNQNRGGALGKHRKAFTDPGTRNWARYNVRANGYANRVTLIRDFSVKAAKKWSAGPVGLLFVDGDHNYDAVRADVSAWAAHLAPDAVIAFDDYAATHPEVIRAVDDMVNEGILEPVKVYHDRLAVTRLGSGHPDLARQEPPEAIEEDLGDGLTETEREADRQAETEREADRQAETVPAAAGHHPVDDANLPLAEWAVPGELGLSQAVRLKDLSLGQLKALAKERGVVLGRDGKTRPVALAKLAEAAGGIA
jgi:Mannosyltransferase OCH1 and related enzymes